VNRRPVTSSNIASIGWEADSQGEGTMEVQFKSGHVYAYHEVPESVYQSALGASSVGKFIASEVVDHFEHTRLK
jgi:KTSC domain